MSGFGVCRSQVVNYHAVDITQCRMQSESDWRFDGWMDCWALATTAVVYKDEGRGFWCVGQRIPVDR
jgi:hypothetical protein